MIKVGDWVRHREYPAFGFRQVKEVIGAYVRVEHVVETWQLANCIPVHPPRDKKPPRKVTWAECEAWLKEQRYEGPRRLKSGAWVFCDWSNHREFTSDTRIGVVIAARAAMRRKERGK